MTTYTNIPDADIDQDSPVTQPLMTALRDNLLSVAEGDATAPAVSLASLGRSSAGTVQIYFDAASFNSSSLNYTETLRPTIITGRGTLVFGYQYYRNNASDVLQLQVLLDGVVVADVLHSSGSTSTYITAPDIEVDYAAPAKLSVQFRQQSGTNFVSMRFSRIKNNGEAVFPIVPEDATLWSIP